MPSNAGTLRRLFPDHLLDVVSQTWPLFWLNLLWQLTWQIYALLKSNKFYTRPSFLSFLHGLRLLLTSLRRSIKNLKIKTTTWLSSIHLNLWTSEVYSEGQACSTSDIAGLCKKSHIQSLTFKPVLADPASWWREEEGSGAQSGGSSSLHQLARSAKTGLTVRDWMCDLLHSPAMSEGAAGLTPRIDLCVYFQFIL